MLEALWVHQQHNVVNEELLKRTLRSPDHRARAAATRVLCYWRDRVKGPLELLKVQVNDENPNVRAEAVRACSFIQSPASLEVALESLNHPDDRYLKFLLEETVNSLEKYAR
jgi:HEAT repeat protein